MNKKAYLYRIIVMIAVMVFAVACSAVVENAEISTGDEESVVGMANPAAVYCGGLGYSDELVERDGGMDSDCILPDETRCAGWDFLAGRCGQAYTYCETHGGLIAEGANIGTCLFADGSICDEYLFFSGECSPGDNPPAVIEDSTQAQEEEEDSAEDIAQTNTEQETVEIHDFIEARDFLAAYFLETYGVEVEEPWIEQNITTDNAVASSTYRYVSGPVTIVLTAEASAPYSPLYTVEEASNISNGFYWEGLLTFDGNITETTVILPGTILDPELARDAVLAYLNSTYGLDSFGTWEDRKEFPAEDGSLLFVYYSEDWMVDVEFIPSAPLVSQYHVIVANLAEEIQWEGNITLQGDIEEISFSQ